jgi:hypothetical protein
MTLLIDGHLTRDPATDAALITHIGQAHFACSGPADQFCGECAFYGTVPGAGFHRCRIFRQLAGKRGAVIPPHANACKYFEPANAAPADTECAAFNQ